MKLRKIRWNSPVSEPGVAQKFSAFIGKLVSPSRGQISVEANVKSCLAGLKSLRIVVIQK